MTLIDTTTSGIEIYPIQQSFYPLATPPQRRGFLQYALSDEITGVGDTLLRSEHPEHSFRLRLRVRVTRVRRTLVVRAETWDPGVPWGDTESGVMLVPGIPCCLVSCSVPIRLT